MEKSKLNHLPLDQITVSILNPKTDQLEQRPALHPDLCKQRLSGNLYQTIPATIHNSHLQYSEMLDAIYADLQWLLSLKYEKFWCQVVNDQSVHASLDSYLKHAPRYQQSAWPEDFSQKHNDLHRLVFMVFLRMSTWKESSENFMSKEMFAQVIYENFLFDIPRLMDICSLYGLRDNRPLLKKMLESIFHNQSHYYDDLKEAANTVLQIIEHIKDKCVAASEHNQLPNRLTNGLPRSPLTDMNEQEFIDLILYVHDTLRTVQAFAIDVFPEAAHSFYEVGFIDKLQHMYSEVFPLLRSELRDRQSSFETRMYHELRTHVRQSRGKTLNIVSGMIKTCAYEHVMKAIDEDSEEKEDMIEEYFNILTSLLSNQRFFDAFSKSFDIRQDVRNLAQACPYAGEAQAQFLFQAMGDPPQLESPSLTISHDSLFSGMQDETSLASSSSLTAQANNQSPPSGIGNAELASLVSSVRDILPDLGVGFVESCIRYYDYNPEKVVQAIFEENLPPHLQSMDRNENGIPNEAIKVESFPACSTFEDVDQPSTSGQQDYLKDRKNIFDNDEFDAFGDGKRIDQAKVHYGKRNKSDVSHWSIDDEKDAEKLRDLYSRYGLGTDVADSDEVLLLDNVSLNYDDEYDDTYDDIAVGANDADSADELMAKKNNEELEEKEQVKESQSKRDPRHFLENPEILRAKEEARRRQRGEDTSGRGRGKRYVRRPPPEKKTYKHPQRRYQDHPPRDHKPQTDSRPEQKSSDAPAEVRRSGDKQVVPNQNSQTDPQPHTVQTGATSERSINDKDNNKKKSKDHPESSSDKSKDKNNDQRKSGKNVRGPHTRKAMSNSRAGKGFSGR